MASVTRTVVLSLQTQGTDRARRNMRQMADSALALERRVHGASRGISSDLRKATRDVNYAGREMQRSFATTARSSSLLRNATAGLTTAFGTRQVMYYADAYKSLHNRLAVVIKDSNQVKFISKQLFDVAQKTRAGWVQTAEAFARTSMTMKNFGVSQMEVVRFTEILNKAISVSGSTSIEAENAVRQLMQGMASGVLRGDELRSVVEQIPYIANLVIEGMGLKGGVGEFRKLAEAGKVSTEAIWKAFFTMGNKVDTDFKKLVPLISASFLNIKNEALRIIGEFDEAVGGSSIFSKGMQTLSDNLQDLLELAGLLVATQLPVWLKKIVEWLSKIFTWGRLALGGLVALVAYSDKIEPMGIVDSIFGPDTDENIITKNTKKIQDLYAVIERGQKTGTLTDYGLVGLKNDIAKAERLVKEARDRIRRDFNEAIQQDLSRLKIDLGLPELYKVDKIKTEYSSLLDMAKAAWNFTTDLVTDPAKAFQFNQLQEIRDAKALARRMEQAELDEAMRKATETGVVTPTTPTGTTGGLGTALPSFAETIRDLERENNLLKLNNEQRMVAEELYRFEDTMKRKLTSTEMERVASLRLMNDALERENEILDSIKAPQKELSETMQIVNKLFQEGKITIDEYNKALSDIGPESDKIANSLSGGAAGALIAFKEMTEEFGQGISTWIVNSFDRATDSIVEFAKTGTLTLDRFFSDIAESMLRFATQQLMANMMGSLFGGLLGPGGALFGASGAAGGVVSAGGTDSSPSGILSSLSGLFSGGSRAPTPAPTPRMKSQGGGVAAPLAALRSSGGVASAGVNLRIMNIMDPREGISALNTAAGEKVIMNTLQKNPAALRKILGAN